MRGDLRRRRLLPLEQQVDRVAFLSAYRTDVVRGCLAMVDRRAAPGHDWLEGGSVVARMYGENAKRYAQRQLGQAGKKEVNEAYARTPRQVVEVECLCTCMVRPYPHRHSEWEKRQFETHRNGNGNVISGNSLWRVEQERDR